MTDQTGGQELLTKLLGGWDAHAEFANGAALAREAFKVVVGDEGVASNVGRYQAINHAFLRRVYLEALESNPEFAATLAWLLWWKIVDFDRLELLSKIEQPKVFTDE